jgi:hypothetical protein
MKKKIINEAKNLEKKLPGYKPYPEDEDIYSKFKEEAIDPEEIVEGVSITGKVEPVNRVINPVPRASELDIPGAELDDDSEALGNEDEENNYYSLGGDNHEDLESDKGN